MEWDIELAQEFRSRENKNQIGNSVGIVKSIDPLKISILDGEVLLNNEQLYCSEHMLVHTANCKINDQQSRIDFENVLNIGDKVLVIPTENQQTWFIIDKIKGA